MRPGGTRFEAGEDVADLMDWSKAKRPTLEIQRVCIDLPAWMIKGLDQEARRLGVTRQALVKMWIAERLDS